MNYSVIAVLLLITLTNELIKKMINNRCFKYKALYILVPLTWH